MEDKIKFCERGIFDYVKVDKVHCQRQYLYQRIIEAKKDEKNPKPFIEEIVIPVGGTGCKDGRLWIPYEGNLHGAIGIHLTMFDSIINQEFFPLIASLGIRDICNRYAPGEYCAKYPNDICCKKHGKKTAGILVRKESGWAICIFCINFVKSPPDTFLRKEGLKACCLSNHTKNIPKISDFLYECGIYFFELLKQYNNIYKIMSWCNEGLSEYGDKIWRGEINNPNADILKDGALWTRDHPNALTKGYLNGEEYELNPTYYDVKYCSAKYDEENKDENIIAEFSKKNKIV